MHTLYAIADEIMAPRIASHRQDRPQGVGRWRRASGA